MSEPAKANGAQPPQQPSLEQQIEATIGIAVACFVSGICSTLSQIFPFDRVLVVLASVLGKAMSAGITADLPTTLKLRQRCREAFDKGMSAAPVRTPMTAQQPVPPPQG